MGSQQLVAPPPPPLPPSPSVTVYYYLELKVSILKTWKVYLIRLKELFQPIVLHKNTGFATFHSMLLKNRLLSNAWVILQQKLQTFNKNLCLYEKQFYRKYQLSTKFASFQLLTNIVIFKAWLERDRPTASTQWILWQGHVKNQLFHFW